MEHCFQITYTNVITGERKTYMNVGFETRDSAKREVKRLMKAAKKHKKDLPEFDLNEAYKSGYSIPTTMVGKYWRVKKVFYRRKDKI